MIVVKFQKEELQQIGILVAEARDSSMLQQSANISYLESIDLNSKIRDILEKAEKEELVRKNYKINNLTSFTVRGEFVVVPDKFDFEKLGYRIEYKEDIIENLIGWIAEGNLMKEEMKDDLKYLISLEDEYVFSSCSTNEYIAVSDNSDSFIKIITRLDDLINKRKEK